MEIKQMTNEQTKLRLEDTGVTQFKERLAMSLEGMSGNAFAKKVGMSEAVIRDYLSGKTYPSLNRLAIIAMKCELPIEWLATGHGLCRLSENKDIQQIIHIPIYQPESIDLPQAETKNFINPPIESLPFDLNLLKSKNFSIEDLNIYWAKGDAMSPTIADNDVLVINTTDVMPFDGYICVIQYGDSISVKRIQNHGKRLLLISDNEKYPSIEIDKSNLDVNFNIIGRVICILKDLS